MVQIHEEGKKMQVESRVQICNVDDVGDFLILLGCEDHDFMLYG